nr:MAG TPA: putative cytoplasmic protein [Caudoviricetes sp.]
MTNRQEVAKKLRAKYKERTMPGFFEPQDVYFYTLNYLKDLEKCLPDGESAFTVLADLIDHTCKPVEADNNIVCSECGADLYDDDLYCPHCGARVVRDEAK